MTVLQHGQAIRVGIFSSDPVGLPDGSIWYNSTDNIFKRVRNGTTEQIAAEQVFGANLAIQSDGNGNLEASAVSSTELGYVSGVTSSIQTQLDAKIDDSEKGAASGVATLNASQKITASQIPSFVITDIFEVADIAARDALTVGTGEGEVSEGDIVIVQDADGSGNRLAYGYDGTEYKVLNDSTVTSVNGQTGAIVLDSDDLSEGSNLYFTEARVLATLLTGYSSTGTTLAATDSVLEAFQKLDAAVENITSGGSSWLLGGQAIASEQNLGSTDDFDVTFIRNSIEHLSLETRGSVFSQDVIAKESAFLIEDGSLNEQGSLGLNEFSGMELGANTSSLTLSVQGADKIGMESGIVTILPNDIDAGFFGFKSASGDSVAEANGNIVLRGVDTDSNLSKATGVDVGYMVARAGDVSAGSIVDPSGAFALLRSGDIDNASNASSTASTFVRTGDTAGDGNTGSLEFRSGNAQAGNSGNVNIQSGSSATGSRGAVNFSASQINSFGDHWAQNSAFIVADGSETEKGFFSYSGTLDDVRIGTSIAGGVFEIAGGAGAVVAGFASDEISFDVPLAMDTNRITGLGDPVNAQDAVTKSYADSIAAGLDPKDSTSVATTADVGGTYNATGGSAGTGSFSGMPDTIDGAALSADNRVLVKNQTDPKQNGIYIVLTVGTGSDGTWERASDHDGNPSAEVSTGNFTFVSRGTVNASTGWVISNGDGTLTFNTDNVEWVQFSAAADFTGGDGIDISGSVLSVDADPSVFQFNTGVLDVAPDGIDGSHFLLATDQWLRTTEGNLLQLEDIGFGDFSFKLNNPTTTGNVVLQSNGTDVFAISGTNGGFISAINNRIQLVADPTDAQDAATKNYVDNNSADLSSVWQLGGQDIASEQNLGSTDAFDVSFIRNSVEYLSLEARGSVFSQDVIANDAVFALESGAIEQGVLNYSSGDSAIQLIASNSNVLEMKLGTALKMAIDSSEIAVVPNAISDGFISNRAFSGDVIMEASGNSIIRGVDSDFNDKATGIDVGYMVARAGDVKTGSALDPSGAYALLRSGDIDEATNASNTASAFVRSGNTAGGGNTGNVTVRSGNAQAGDSGSVNIQSGSSASGTRGAVALEGSEVVATADSVKKGPNATDFFVERYEPSVTLTGSATSTIASAFDFTVADFEAIHVEYKIKDATSGAVRVGRIMVVSDGTTASVTDVFDTIGTMSVSWSAQVNTGTVQLAYTTDANDKSMNAVIKYIQA